jgi:hypothetical protein
MSFAGRGELDVLLDGKTIFSYGAQGRMLRRGEIVTLIQGAARG